MATNWQNFTEIYVAEWKYCKKALGEATFLLTLSVYANCLPAATHLCFVEQGFREVVHFMSNEIKNAPNEEFSSAIRMTTSTYFIACVSGTKINHADRQQSLNITSFSFCCQHKP